MPPGDHRLRGGRSSREWFSFYGKIVGFEGILFGFRPLLEPLGDPASLTEDNLGKKIVVYGPDGMSISGTLSRLDDYDLVLSTADIPEDCGWTGSIRDHTIINRKDVSLMQKIS